MADLDQVTIEFVGKGLVPLREEEYVFLARVSLKTYFESGRELNQFLAQGNLRLGEGKPVTVDEQYWHQTHEILRRREHEPIITIGLFGRRAKL